MLTPNSEQELAEAIASTARPLRIQGGGTRPIGHAVDGDTLSTAGLSGITLYEPGALTIVARSGTPLAEIESALASENQRLPFEPMDHRSLLGTEGTPTIGGVVAANVSGSRRIQAGACRDSLIGVRFVDGQGSIIKNGGRVMKNVTGYDLVKLMAGAHGTLGVLSEVSFKVLPATDRTGVLFIDGLSVADATVAMSRALVSPFEVSGAAHAPKGVDGHAVTMIRIEGFDASVSYRSEKLRALLQEFGETLVETDPDRNRARWAWVRDATLLGDHDGDVWRISAKPTDAPAIVARLEGATCLLDWGGGLIWAGVAADQDVRVAIDGIAGHATLIRGSDETKDRFGVLHPEIATLARLAEGLRHQFDPKRVLNPGLMG